LHFTRPCKFFFIVRYDVLVKRNFYSSNVVMRCVERRDVLYSCDEVSFDFCCVVLCCVLVSLSFWIMKFQVFLIIFFYP
jgi:hypothetical protein